MLIHAIIIQNVLIYLSTLCTLISPHIRSAYSTLAMLQLHLLQLQTSHRSAELKRCIGSHGNYRISHFALMQLGLGEINDADLVVFGENDMISIMHTSMKKACFVYLTCIINHKTTELIL